MIDPLRYAHQQVSDHDFGSLEVVEATAPVFVSIVARQHVNRPSINGQWASVSVPIIRRPGYCDVERSFGFFDAALQVADGVHLGQVHPDRDQCLRDV